MSNKRPKCKNDKLIVSQNAVSFPQSREKRWGRKITNKNGTRLLNPKEPFPGSVTARVAELCKTQKINACLPLATLPQAVLLTFKLCTSAMPVGQTTSLLSQQDDLPGSYQVPEQEPTHKCRCTAESRTETVQRYIFSSAGWPSHYY